MFGVTAVAISLPLALTSCSSTQNNPIEFTTNLANVSYFTDKDGVDLKVSATLNNNNDSQLFYKWFYKSGDTQSKYNKQFNINGWIPVWNNKNNDGNTLILPSKQIIGKDLQFKCAVYEQKNPSIYSWSNVTLLKPAITISNFSVDKLKYAVSQIETNNWNTDMGCEANIKQTIVKSGCGLTENQIASVQLLPQTLKNQFFAIESPSNYSDNDAIISNVGKSSYIDILIVLNKQFQFSNGTRSNTIDHILTQFETIDINQSVLSRKIQSLEKLYSVSTAQQLVDHCFNSSRDILDFFKYYSPDKNLDVIQSASAVAINPEQGIFQQVQFNLNLKPGYWYNNSSQATIVVNTSFLQDPKKVYLAQSNIEQFINQFNTEVNKIGSINANELIPESYTFTASNKITLSKNADDYTPAGQKWNAKIYEAIIKDLNIRQNANQIQSIRISRQNKQTEECNSGGVGVTLPIQITIKLNDGYTFANPNGNQDSWTESGTISNSYGSTNYSCQFESNQMTINTNLYGFSLAINFGQQTNGGTINLTGSDLVKFKNLITDHISIDLNAPIIVNKDRDSKNFKILSDALGLPEELLVSFKISEDKNKLVTVVVQTINGCAFMGGGSITDSSITAKKSFVFPYCKASQVTITWKNSK